MNPKAQRSILIQSRIFGYSAAVLSVPFAVVGGLVASCCPFGVLVGAVPLLITSGLGAQLAAVFLDYSVVSRRCSTGAGLRVGVRSATLAALAGGIFTLFTASQSLSAMTAAAGAGDPEGSGVVAAITIGLMNLVMLLAVAALCALLAIVPGVIGAAIRGSAAQDSEPASKPEWDVELRALRKSSLIEWAVLLGLLASVSLVVPAIQQYSIGKGLPERSSGRSVAMSAANTSGVPLSAPSGMSRSVESSPFSVSPDAKYSVEICDDIERGRLLLVRGHGRHLFEEQLTGYLQDVYWSPGGHFVAINERIGNSGDYLWILDLQRQRVLKRPDDTIWQETESKFIPVVREMASRKWGGGVQDDRGWGVASGWEDDNTLLVRFTVRFLGSAIAVGEDSRLEVVFRLRVAANGVSIQKETQGGSRADSGFVDPHPTEVEALLSELDVQPRMERPFPPDPRLGPELLEFSNALKSIWSGEALAVNSLSGLSPWELRVLRNAVFARHGRAFESGKLSGFFHRYPGYKEDPDYSDNRITSVDRSNVEAIKDLEVRAKRPPRDTSWNALRGFVDALAAGDVDYIRSSIHPASPLERVIFTLEDAPKLISQERLLGNSIELQELCLGDGANGEGSSFMMSVIWNFTLSAQQADIGMFRNRESLTEIGFTEIAGSWWLSRIADAVP
jgi:hypothetical protein